MQFVPNNIWLRMLIFVIGVILFLLFAGAVFGMVKNYQTNKQPDNVRFKSGHYPSRPLDGIYKGSWMSNQTDWQGKEFFASSSSGINNFTNGQRYRFKTYQAKSLSTGQKVLKIDYNLAGNPFWISRIVDEMVEVEPGKYQGKVYVKYLPGLTFALTYFTLERQYI